MKIKNALLLLLTATIWGIAFVAQSVGMDYVEPFTFNAVRSTIGGITLLPVIAVLRKLQEKNSVCENPEQASQKKQEGSHLSLRSLLQNPTLAGGVCCGILLFAASNFQQFGVKYTTVGKAGFITACYIILVPILGLFFRKKCSPAIAAAVVIAVVGLYLLCMDGSGFSLSMGDGLVFICAVLFSFHIMVVDHYSPIADGVVMSCIQFFVCGLLSAVCCLLFETPQLSNITAAAVPILYAGVMSCGVAYTLQIVGQKGVNPTIASLILSLESSISVLAGWVLLGQSMNTRQLFGCFCMLSAIILAQIPIPVAFRREKSVENS